jgi:EAL domain-containing protein (putative c-di-GMP-specific phosphodiesterase class I)
LSTTETSSDFQELQDILDHDSIVPVFQPIVDLVTGSTAAYEALSRGPSESPLRTPEQLFAVAGRYGLVDELDWACRVAALKQALAAGIRPPLTVFLNIEPTVVSEAPERAGPVLARAMAGLRVIVELTERELLAHPASLLDEVEAIRQTGWGVALDDIGAHPHSLAMMPVIEPDVVKVDQASLRCMPKAMASDVVSGVMTYCRRSGASCVVEGLESDEDLATARTLQTRYGEGWKLGKPDAMTSRPRSMFAPVPLLNPRPHRPAHRLIALVTRRDPPQQLKRRAVDKLTDDVLHHAAAMGGEVLVVACVQSQANLTEQLRQQLEKLATQVAHVSILGGGVTSPVAANVRGTRLTVDDPLVCEWVIAVIGLHESIALVAADLGDDYNDILNRRYDAAVTYDPTLVTDIARALLTRVA